jgi:hypothetical protein
MNLMYTIIVGIITIVLSGLIALLALSIGGYPTMLKVLFHLHFSPARFYFNVMRAIERLEALGEKGVDQQGKELKTGSVPLGDTGFCELVKVLKENRMVEGEVQRVSLVEDTASIGIGNISPEIVRFLVVVSDGKTEILRTDPFDPTKVIRELKDWAEAITRKRVARWLVVLILLYMIAGIYLVLTT